MNRRSFFAKVVGLVAVVPFLKKPKKQLTWEKLQEVKAQFWNNSEFVDEFSGGTSKFYFTSEIPTGTEFPWLRTDPDGQIVGWHCWHNGEWVNVSDLLKA